MDVNVRYVENVIILELAGSLDWSTASQMRQAVVDAMTGQPAQVVVNMQEVYFLDSSGLAALVLGLKRARENRSNFCLCALQSSVRMIFELTRFDKIFEIFVNEEDAILAVANQH